LERARRKGRNGDVKIVKKAKFTKYECWEGGEEVCADCSNLKPHEQRTIFNYYGKWSCKACGEVKDEQRTEDGMVLGESEVEEKNRECGDCTCEGYTKYECSECEVEFCADCRQLKPYEHRAILSYYGNWVCKACGDAMDTQPSKAGEEQKEELVAKLTALVEKLLDRVDKMEKLLLEKEEKTKTVSPRVSYASASAHNAGPAGPVIYVDNSQGPAEMMSREQEMIKERRMNVIVRGVEEHPDPEAEGFIKKAYDIRQAATIASMKDQEHNASD
jgi:hypothetical protein